MLRRKIFFSLFCVCLVGLFSAGPRAQEISFNYTYKFDYADADELPQVTGLNFDYPEAARKNGVEGTLRAVLVLGENGRTRDIKVEQGLPFGVTEAVIKALEGLFFQPARRNGQAVPMTMFFDFVVSAVYEESDRNVTKPSIVEKPAPVYPSKYAGEKLKGKVDVLVLFFPDGTLKVLGMNSVMPREFDHAAADAAAKIKFRPAVHKKSKAEVAQKMMVTFDFKP